MSAAAIAKLRNGDNLIERALRMGTCYPHETTFVPLLVHKRLP